MRAAQGKWGRVFVLKFDHGDDFVEALRDFARRKRIRTAVCLFLGALARGKIVTGPRRAVIPPEPNWVCVRDGWEMFGVGSVFAGPDGPAVHLHGSLGKKRRVFTGCVRKDARVFCVIEAFVFELKGVGARKGVDAATGLNLLQISARA
ncbi:MAG: PPC domain-containing DNA-binding protein [Deltaproteobacteria bacterium]